MALLKLVNRDFAETYVFGTAVRDCMRGAVWYVHEYARRFRKHMRLRQEPFSWAIAHGFGSGDDFDGP